MLALRILVIACAVVIVFALLGYAINRDSRWLKIAGHALKGGVAIAALIGIIMLWRRLLAM